MREQVCVCVFVGVCACMRVCQRVFCFECLFSCMCMRALFCADYLCIIIVLTCLTQGMYDQRESIQQRIMTLWESYKGRMPTESYVADFAVTPERCGNMQRTAYLFT